MNKTLLYYIYVTPDFFTRITNLVNIECLRRYSNVFDSAKIFLSLDDTNDKELINKVEHLFIDMGFNGNISFVIHKNDEYRESAVLKEELADKLYELDGLIFFGHGKGFSNIDTGYEKESMLHWIAGEYYLSLQFIDEVLDLITGSSTFSAYGSFPMILNERKHTDDVLEKDELYLGRIKYNWCYSGTFFWVNPARLYDQMAVFRQEVPRMHNRYYSEKFLGNVMSYGGNACGHNMMYLWHTNNMYNDGVAESCIKFILKTDEEMGRYYEFYKEILKNVKERYGVE